MRSEAATPLSAGCTCPLRATGLAHVVHIGYACCQKSGCHEPHINDDASNQRRPNLKNNMFIFVTFSVTAILTLGAIAMGHDVVQDRQAVSKTPSAVNGKAMFDAYCTPCHGKEAKGDGPAAAALKKPPADLTRISARNNGTFPTEKVRRFIDG